MRVTVEFGEGEKHLLEFEFNQLLGTSTIKVDGQVLKRQTRWFSEPIRQIHEVDLGAFERWNVRIEKERKLLYGQRCRVFVNHRLAAVHEGV